MCPKRKKKDIDVKGFNMITSKNEAKTMTKHISCDCKCKFNSATCNSDQKWKNKTCQCECENYRKRKKYYSWNPSTCICENSRYLKSMSDTSVIECDEFVTVTDTASTKITNNYSNKCYEYCFNKLS